MPYFLLSFCPYPHRKTNVLYPKDRIPHPIPPIINPYRANISAPVISGRKSAFSKPALPKNNFARISHPASRLCGDPPPKSSLPKPAKSTPVADSAVAADLYADFSTGKRAGSGNPQKNAVPHPVFRAESRGSPPEIPVKKQFLPSGGAQLPMILLHHPEFRAAKVPYPHEVQSLGTVTFCGASFDRSSPSAVSNRLLLTAGCVF